MANEIREGEASTRLRESIAKHSLGQQSSFFQNREPVMKMVRDFEKRAVSVGHRALTKEATKYVDKCGLQIKLQYPDPASPTNKGEVTP